MLIVDKEENLEKLKGFGFKPKYNEDTGEIYKYIVISDIPEAKPQEVILMTIEQCKEQVSDFYEFRTYWKVKLGKNYNMALDLLYDLIDAGIIKKDKK